MNLLEAVSQLDQAERRVVELETERQHHWNKLIVEAEFRRRNRHLRKYTQCRVGHSVREVGIYRDRDGKQSCKRCRRDAWNRWYAKQERGLDGNP